MKCGLSIKLEYSHACFQIFFLLWRINLIHVPNVHSVEETGLLQPWSWSFQNKEKKEAVVQSSGSCTCLESWGSWVQDMFWSLVEFVPGSPWFNFWASLLNNHLSCLRPVGVLNSCCYLFCSVAIVFDWLWKAPMGSGQLGMYCTCIVLNCNICW